MPSSLIEVRRSYTADEEVAIMDAVHAALVAAFKVPDDDRHVRFVTFEPHRMVNGIAPGVADRFTRVTIDCYSGRSVDAKRVLYREIAERLEVLDIPREDVVILLRESPAENWGMNGRPASDSGMGTNITV